MKKTKKIISSVLSSIILAENFSFAFAKTPFSIYENSSSCESDSSHENDSNHESDSSYESDDELPPSTAFYSYPTPVNDKNGLQNLPHLIPSLKVINNEMCYIPQQLTEAENPTNDVPEETSNSHIYSTVIQPQFINISLSPFQQRETLKLEITEQEIRDNLSNSFFPQTVISTPNLKLDLDSISPLPISAQVIEPIQNYKSPTESFKPAKNQEETTKTFPYNSIIRRLSPNSLSLEMWATYKKIENDLNFDQSFNYISNYIFDKSLPTLQELYSSTSLDSTKNFFINSRNQSILSPIKLACSKYIENSDLPENEKCTLQKFLNLCSALDSTSENVCILILVYAQILKATDPVFDPMLSKSLRKISNNVLEKLKETNNLKIKNWKLFYTIADDLKRINKHKNVYVLMFRSIIENTIKGVIGIDSLYNEIKLDKYISLISDNKK